jgi:hypothetical protein
MKKNHIFLLFAMFLGLTLSGNAFATTSVKPLNATANIIVATAPPGGHCNTDADCEKPAVCGPLHHCHIP